MLRAERRCWMWLGAQEVRAGLCGGPGAKQAEPIVARLQPVDDKPVTQSLLLEALAPVMQQIKAQVPGQQTPELEVWVSSRWMGWASLPWSTLLLRPDSADGFARSRLQAAGLQVDSVDVVRIDDAPFGQMRSATLYPSRLLSGLTSAANKSGLNLVSVLPVWLAPGLRDELVRGAPLAGLALIEKLEVMFATLRGGKLAPLSAPSPLDPSTTLPLAVAQSFQRLQLRRAELATMAKLGVLSLDPLRQREDWASTTHLTPLAGGNARAAAAADPFQWLFQGASKRSEALNALEPKASLTPAAAWALAASLLLLVGGGYAALKAQERLQVVRAEARSTPAAAPVVSSKQVSRQELAQRSAVNVAIQQLNLPVNQVFAALKPPNDVRAALLTLDFQPNRNSSGGDEGAGGLKLTAEAPTSVDMTRYVAYLANRPPLVAAYLASHEIAETEPTLPYRFTVEAQWQK